MLSCCRHGDGAEHELEESDESSSDDHETHISEPLFNSRIRAASRDDSSMDQDFLRARSRTVLGAQCPASVGPNADMLEEAVNHAIATETADPDSADACESGAPRWARVAVFWVLCQAVQMFMSYDGGALPASLDTLQEKLGPTRHISALELSIVNAMDKVGIVAASVPWGIALRKCNAKGLLTCSLLINAATTVAFGYLWFSVPLMVLAKFVMGVTQALQGVWGTVWTVAMAPPDRKTTWLGMGAISAGLGNGIGTCVAGYGTANGLPYDFAFLVAGFVLSGLWVLQLLFPSFWLRVELSPEGGGGAVENGREGKDRSSGGFWSSYQQFIGNKVYLWTALSNSLAVFQATGIQFLFIQGFTVIWATGEHQPLNKNWVTTMFLIVSGGGGALGVVFGPLIIDRQGGFTLWPDMVRTLFILMIFQAFAGIGGIIGVWCLYGKEHSDELYSGEWGDAWLWGTWFAIFLIMAAQNGCVAALCGINVQVVPPELRTAASGFEMAVRFSLGAIGGSVAPGFLMSLIEHGDEAYKQMVGLGFVLAMNMAGLPMMGAARHAAAFKLHSERHQALSKLRQVCQEEDVLALEQAVAAAMQVKLQAWDEGSTAIGYANELIGQLRGGAVVNRPTSNLSLQRKVAEQEKEIASLKETIAKLQAEVNAARGMG